jgi:hypothetical protein
MNINHCPNKTDMHFQKSKNFITTILHPVHKNSSISSTVFFGPWAAGTVFRLIFEKNNRLATLVL